MPQSNANSPFVFNTTPSIVFGFSSLNQIGTLSARKLGHRILIVTDRGLMGQGFIQRAISLIEQEGLQVAVFDEVVADPPVPVIDKAVAMARLNQITGVIGLGGGSSLDVAKLVALMLASTQPLADAYGVGNALGPRLPLMLVPTTAGTGSEVTPISIVTTGDKEKKGVVSPWLLPDIALLDPELTLGLPPHITAATGIDAMVHAIEAFTSLSPNNNPLSRALAREALRLLGKSIAVAVHGGSDQNARSDMLLGSMLAGQAFANAPVAAVHALAYPLGGHFHIAHGLSNALVLPHVIRFNAPACADAYAELATILFPELAHDLAALPHLGRALAFADSFQELSARLGLPTRLRDLDIPASAIEALADDAMKQTRLLVNNPRLVSHADVIDLYKAAW
jgi:alcohol dehydrogenase class IV